MRPVPRMALATVTRELTAPGPLGTFHPFDDNPELRGAWIVGVEHFVYTELATMPNGQQVTGAIAGMLLTMADQERLVVKDMPLMSIWTPGQLGIFKQFHPFRINMSRSGVTFAGTVGATYEMAGFIFHYFRQEDLDNGRVKL